eukprot:3601031-Pleurochrysis_carterae.AAC.2
MRWRAPRCPRDIDTKAMNPAMSSQRPTAKLCMRPGSRQSPGSAHLLRGILVKLKECAQSAGSLAPSLPYLGWEGSSASAYDDRICVAQSRLKRLSTDPKVGFEQLNIWLVKKLLD